MDGYRELAAAIVEKAVEDYMRSSYELRMGSISSTRKKRRLENLREDAIQFMDSGWWSMLTDLDATVVRKKLDSRVARKVERTKAYMLRQELKAS